MQRDLVNTACAIGATVFVVTLFYEIILNPSGSDGPSDAASLGETWPNLPPVESAVRLIEDAVETHRADAGLWQDVSQRLLRTKDPLGALDELDASLGDEPQRAIAATGYTAYYLGYHLMMNDENAAARASWERGLESFRAWEHVQRPRLAGNDAVYLARTLMRLGRDSEAYEAIRDVAGVENGATTSYNESVLLARTLGEIGREQRARAILDQTLDAYPDNHRLLNELVRDSPRWARSNERDAARVAQQAAATALIRSFATPQSQAIEHYRLARDNALSLKSLGDPQTATTVLAAAAAAADEAAPRYDRAQIYAWAARLHALAGDAAAAAASIAAAPRFSLSPDELVDSPDLAPLMRLQEIRDAVRVHGEPDEWTAAEPDSP